MDGWIHGSMDDWVGGLDLGGWVNGWTGWSQWVGGWMDGWMDG